jgi:hypothetical protein
MSFGRFVPGAAACRPAAIAVWTLARALSIATGSRADADALVRAWAVAERMSNKNSATVAIARPER